MEVDDYIESESIRPLLICGDSLEVIKKIPSNCIDMAITSS